MGRLVRASSRRCRWWAALGAGAALCLVGLRVLPPAWKLLRLPWLVSTVEIGLDLFDPASGNEQIPAIVHHLSETEHIPEDWLQSYQSSKGVHMRYGADAYEHMLWTDLKIEKFMRQWHPDFMPTFEAYKYNIERVDAARYFILLHYGGIYMDLDVGCRRSLDNLRRFDGVRTPARTSLILPLTKPLGVSNDFIMAAPQHPFLLFVTKRLAARTHESRSFLPFLSVLWTTGPLFLSAALYDFLSTEDGARHRFELGLLSSHDYTKALLYHLPGSSWLGWDGKALLWLWYSLVPALGRRLLLGAGLAACAGVLAVLARRVRAAGGAAAGGGVSAGGGDVSALSSISPRTRRSGPKDQNV